MTNRKARDLTLLDALDAQSGVAFDGDVWPIVREGVLFLDRFNPGDLDVQTSEPVDWMAWRSAASP